MADFDASRLQDQFFSYFRKDLMEFCCAFHDTMGQPWKLSECDVQQYTAT